MVRENCVCSGNVRLVMDLCQSIWKETACSLHSASVTGDDQVGLLATQCPPSHFLTLPNVRDLYLHDASLLPVLPAQRQGLPREMLRVTKSLAGWVGLAETPF